MIKDLTSAIIFLFVGIAILLVGMKMMSSGLRKSIGRGIKRFFRKTQDSPFISMGIGAVVTAGIQSSDATNVMVIGFINAGVMTLYQGLCMMLGSYIGTTATGVLASFSSLSISTYFLLFSFIGVMMMFFKKELIQNLGEILCGLGIIFFGIALLKDAFSYPDITNATKNLFTSISFGPLLFIIGVLITALIQSSSATTSVVIALVGSGALCLGDGFYIVLGATLGTVVTTLLATIGGSIKGKRAAIIIFIIRAITSLIMLILLCIFESAIVKGMRVFSINGNDELPLAMFVVFYNLIFMPLCLPLLKPFISLSNKFVKNKELDEKRKAIHFIDDKLLNTPDIASMQVKKEIINMYELSFVNYRNAINKFLLNDSSKDEEIVKIEDQIDYLNSQITEFLINLSSKVQPSLEKKIGAYFHVINDIERIGDHAFNFYEMFGDMKNKELVFSNDAINEIGEFNTTIFEMFNLSIDIFKNKDKNKLLHLHELENITDELKIKFSTNHYERIKHKKCANELSPFYCTIMTELERIADHLTNIGYSIIDPVGNDE